MNYIKDNNNRYSVVIGGRHMEFDPTHKQYIQLVDALKKNDHKKFERVFVDGTKIANWSRGHFKCYQGIITYKGEQLPDNIQQRIVEQISEGFDATGMLRFADKCIASGRYRTVANLLTFLEHKHIPINNNGNIVAWKGVKVYHDEPFIDKMRRLVKEGDYVDVHSETLRNNVGDRNTMPAHLVVDDPSQGCGPGLHVANISYAKGWTTDGTVVQVEVDPRNVISIPNDSSCQKMRCSDYKVIGELHGRNA